MSKIDVNPWKQFCIGELFEVCTTKSLDKLLLDMNDSYEYPYIGRTGSDNGVQGYVQQQSFKPNDGHTFSVVQIGERVCQYRECEWYASQNMFLLKPLYDDVEMTALFMTTIITNALKQKFSGSAYSEYPTKISLTEMIISLPATPSGEPDWDYMENYMKAVMEREEVFAEHLASLTAEAVADGHPIDVSAWGEFHLYDIFDIDMGNKFDRGKMPVGEDINFVGRTGLNNGVNAVCSKYQETEPYTAGYLTLALGGTIGACFVQNEPFYTSQNVIVLKPKKDVPFVVKQFMACVIYNVSRSRYCAFSDELNKHIKTDFVFSLPVTPSGEPDWAYMEQFMQQQMDKSQQLVEHLDQIWN